MMTVRKTWNASTEGDAMYARSIAFHTRQDVTTDQASAIYQEMVLLLSDADGFLGATFMMNPETNHALSLTFWRDRECGAAAGPSLLPVLLVKVHPLVVAPPEISGFEVIDQSFEFEKLSAS
jgi:hypothetical protein